MGMHVTSTRTLNSLCAPHAPQSLLHTPIRSVHISLHPAGQDMINMTCFMALGWTPCYAHVPFSSPYPAHEAQVGMCRLPVRPYAFRGGRTVWKGWDRWWSDRITLLGQDICRTGRQHR